MPTAKSIWWSAAPGGASSGRPTARPSRRERLDSRPSLRRFHIIGGAGSGKSTLAEKLAAGLKTPVYHLDALNFVGGSERTRPYADRIADAQRIAAEPAWVAEGIFLGWTDALLQAADRIIWLDLPMHIALYRIVRRYLVASYRGTNRYRGVLRLLRFLRWSAAYYRHLSPEQIDALPEESLHSRTATARHLAPYRHKLARCCTSAEVDDLLAALGVSGVAAVVKAG